VRSKLNNELKVVAGEVVAGVCAAICGPDAHSQNIASIMEIPDFLMVADNPANQSLRTAANLCRLLQIRKQRHGRLGDGCASAHHLTSNVVGGESCSSPKSAKGQGGGCELQNHFPKVHSPFSNIAIFGASRARKSACQSQPERTKLTRVC
jgi:hypothetical protein